MRRYVAVREEQIAEAKRKIVEDAPSQNVSEGLTTGAEEEKAKTDELIALQAEANALKKIELGASWPTALGNEFDPNWEPPVSREEQIDPPVTVGEMKASLLEPDEKSVAHGFTTDEGEPISMDEAMQKSKGVDGFPAPSGPRAVGIH
jgi:hypothetical protein